MSNVRLTPELIRSVQGYINALNLRELDLRGHRVPFIENLGVTDDSYQCLDLSENAILKLGNFPNLPSLEALMVHSNKVARIASGMVCVSSCVSVCVCDVGGVLL
jgi:U2 small nuclear ribonucleoprotein A'